MKVLITGGQGQLAQTLNNLLQTEEKFNWETDFQSSKELDITDFEAVTRMPWGVRSMPTASIVLPSHMWTKPKQIRSWLIKSM